MGGNIYQASGLMLEAPKIDSLTYEFKEKRLFSDEGYYIKAYGKIPFTRDNYYRIRVIENDTLKIYCADEKGIDKDGIIRVEIDSHYFRPTEVDSLLGDASKAEKELRWKAKTKFEDLVTIMAEADWEKVQKRGF